MCWLVCNTAVVITRRCSLICPPTFLPLFWKVPQEGKVRLLLGIWKHQEARLTHVTWCKVQRNNATSLLTLKAIINPVSLGPLALFTCCSALESTVQQQIFCLSILLQGRQSALSCSHHKLQGYYISVVSVAGRLLYLLRGRVKAGRKSRWDWRFLAASSQAEWEWKDCVWILSH